MNKTISTRQFATIKRVAMSVSPMVSKKQTLLKKIKECETEIRDLDVQIAGFEAGIKAMCFGLGSEQLVHKVVSPTGKEDKNGKPLTKTSYEPNNCLVYNEANNNYTLTVEEEKEAESNEIPLIEDVEEVEHREPKFREVTFFQL